jgi:hypothetical protein
MKNKLLITTALASSLVAGSAIAQTTITGSLGVSYKSVQGKNQTANGNSFGKESQLNVANKGKLNIGGLSYAAGFSLEFDGSDGVYSYTPKVDAVGQLGTASAVTVTTSVQSRQTGTSGWHLENNYIDIISESTGTTLTISSDHIQNARGGLANIVGQHAEDFTGGVNKTTNSLAMDYAGTTVAESFGVGIVQNVGKFGKVSYLYVPNHTSAGISLTKNSSTQSGGAVADDGDAILTADDAPIAHEYGFIGDLGVKGLTVKAFKSEQDKAHTQLNKTSGTNLGIRYNIDAFTIGVNQMKQKVGSASATTVDADASIGRAATIASNTETKQMEYGLGFAVNKDLSIGLYQNKAERKTPAGLKTTEKTRSIAVGYSLGPVALSAQYGQVDDMGGTAGKDANVMFMSLTTAF